MNIFLCLNNCWFYPRQIYSDIHSWSIYTDKYIRIFICPIYMIANTFDILVCHKNCYKWLLMVQNGLVWVQNNTKYENRQNSPKQSWAYILIFGYVRIFWTNIFICQIICKFFQGAFIRIFIRDILIRLNIFGYSFIQYLW